MYHHLRGRILESRGTSVVVEVGGVGYALNVPLSTAEALRPGDDACLLTHLLVREDDLRLYGFATGEEREVYRLCLGVAGVGPTLALAILSTLPVNEILRALDVEDAKSLQRVKGIGRKLAERMVLELRDRGRSLRRRLSLPGVPDTSTAPAEAAVDLIEESSSVLIELGFAERDAEKRAGDIVRGWDGASGAPSVEEIVREALRRG